MQQLVKIGGQHSYNTVPNIRGIETSMLFVCLPTYLKCTWTKLYKVGLVNVKTWDLEWDTESLQRLYLSNDQVIMGEDEHDEIYMVQKTAGANWAPVILNTCETTNVTTCLQKIMFLHVNTLEDCKQ